MAAVLIYVPPVSACVLAIVQFHVKNHAAHVQTCVDTGVTHLVIGNVSITAQIDVFRLALDTAQHM